MAMPEQLVPWRRWMRVALAATAVLLASGSLTPAASQSGGFCPSGSYCEAVVGETKYQVIGPCDLSSLSTISACLVIGTVPVPGGSEEPLEVCDVHGCGPGDIVQADLGTMNGLQQEAQQQIAALRGIADDRLNIYWSRGQIRAYMFLRLLGMAFAQPGTLPPQDQLVVDHYTHVINHERIAMARTALDLYNAWNANKCGFLVPVGDPNAYLAQTDVAGSIAAPCNLPPNSPACLLGACIPDPPRAEEFTAWATGVRLQSQIRGWATGLQQESGGALTDEEAKVRAAIEHALATGGVHEGMSYLAAIHASVADVPAATLSEIQRNLEEQWLAALKDFAGTQFRDVVINAVATVFFALVSDVVVQGFAAGLVNAFNNVIAPALAAAAVIAYTTWEAVENAEVLTKLEKSLEDAEAGHGLAHYAADATGRALMLEVFVKSTLPDYLTERLEDPDSMAPGAGPASASDPVFLQGQQSSVSGSFMSEAWNGDTVFTSVRNGWFVQTRNNGPYRRVPSVDYVGGASFECDENNECSVTGRREHWRAWLHGTEFLAQRISVEAGFGTVNHAINLCGANMPLLPTGNIDFGNLCVLASGTFDLPIESGDHVVLDGQVRTVASVSRDAGGQVTAFSTTAPFDHIESAVPVMVLTRADGNCMTASSLGARVAGPDCVASDTIQTTLGDATIWSRPTLTITASSASVSYTGPAPAITPSYSGFVSGHTADSLAAPPTCGTVYTAGSFPGIYQSHCSGAADPRYHIVYVPGTVVVPSGPMTITASSPTVAYGDPIPTIAPDYAGQPQALLQTLPTCTTSYTPGSPPGTYSTSCSGAAAPDGGSECTFPVEGPPTCVHAGPRFEIEYVSGTLTVEPAPLTVAASSPSVTYGDAAPAIAPIYSGFVNGDTAASLTTPATCATLYTAGGGVGTYGTSCSSAASANYAIAYVAGSLTVAPRPLTVAAAHLTKTYGQTVFFAGTEFTTSALVNGDTVTGVTLASPGAAASAGVAGSPYAIVPGAAAGTGLGNYVIGYVNGSLTVNPAALTVTASSETMIIGDAVPTIEPLYSGFAAGEGAASLTARAGCTTTATSGSPAGTYPSTCSGAASPNYSIEYIDGTVGVTYAVSAVVDTPSTSVSGSTIPVIFQLIDASGNNLSSRQIGVALATPAISPNPGSAPQPTGEFIDAGKQYVYTLKTTDYPPGTYTLAFTVAGDPVVHRIAFAIR